jgi:hypothetical protein
MREAVHDEDPHPGEAPHVITELYAFVAIDPACGCEGIMAMVDERGKGWVPMIGSDQRRVDTLRPIADAIAKGGGITYRILKFTLTGEEDPSCGSISGRA